MILGNKHFFKKEHYEAHKGLAPAYLCELVVYCLELVSQLAYHKLKFRFKGGNSLLILLENPQRFSIDVDIATIVSKEELINLVGKIVQECEQFIQFEIRQPKTKPWLPLISFKLFFKSFYQEPENAFVMLDAVLEEPPYPGIFKQVKCGTIYHSQQEVEVPEISGLMADKLLTIGPKTLGIPIGKNKEAQRLKHIFDIALLEQQKYDINQFKDNLNNCIIQENTIQKINISYKDIIEDTKLFVSKALNFPEKPDINDTVHDDYLFEIIKGFDEFKKHLFKINYTWEMLQTDCQKVLLLLDYLSK